ncbi:hypothetical protein ACHMW5_02405 [Azospirillum melinis]|uniref:hypothetical protein n=1 Tax=Azospirillum melinis TaxID=328839 RepID=UPI003757E9CC
MNAVTAQPRRRVPEGLRASLPMLVLVRGLTDAQIAGEWGLEAWQVAGLRRAIGLVNHRGWPCADAELRCLVLTDRLTDAEIGARFEVRPRTVEVRRLRIGLRRPNDPRPEARRDVIVLDEVRRRMMLERTPIERAMQALGPRLAMGRHGAYTLDGRMVSVMEVIRMAGYDLH